MEEIKLFELDEDLVSSAMVKDDTMYINFSLNKIKNGFSILYGFYNLNISDFH